MGKLSNAEIATAIINVKEEAKALHANTHPYWGIRDSRGWLTRYPLQEEMISERWMREYIDAGGSLDSCGVYGITPYRRWIEKYPPTQVAGWVGDAYGGRWNSVPYLSGIEKYCEIHPTATLADLYRMQRGSEFFAICDLCGIDRSNKSIFWGHRMWLKYRLPGDTYITIWDNQLLQKWLLDRATIPASLFREIPSQVARVETSNPFGTHLIRCAKKCVERDRLKNLVRENGTKLPMRYHRTTRRVMWDGLVSTKLGAKYALKLGPHIRTSEGNIASIVTTKGVEYLSKDGVMLNYRWVGDIKVIKIGVTCFAWKGTFRTHAEGLTVRDAIDLLLNRVGITTNKVSFAMVYKAKRYCLPGTREWLLDNMPFLGRLLQPYSQWSDVPSDLMNHIWEFTSRDVFRTRLD